VKKIYKILAIIITPILLGSFTGVEVHFHLCKETGKVYSDIHLAGSGHKMEEPCCCMDDHGEPPACADAACTSSHGTDESCCVDIQQEIVTDDTFKTSGFAFKVMITELEVLGIQFSNSLYNNRILSNINWTSKPTYSTPLETRTILIL
jgi:hypothetical protein